MLFRKAIVIVFCTGLISVTVLAQEEEEKATLNQVNLDNNQTQPATLATKPPVKNKDWTNTVHQTISDSVFHSVAWFDSFFIEDDDSYLSPQSIARIRLEWKPKAGDFSEMGARFKNTILALGGSRSARGGDARRRCSRDGTSAAWPTRG